MEEFISVSKQSMTSLTNPGCHYLLLGHFFQTHTKL